ncbi:hypothetical protein OZG82_16365, partial [Escherichia coli]|nr:hypothetical protein [Escherichia coli]
TSAVATGSGKKRDASPCARSIVLEKSSLSTSAVLRFLLLIRIFGTVVGVVAPPVFSPVLGPGSVPSGDIIGAIGGEFISNAVKDEINGTKK